MQFPARFAGLPPYAFPRLRALLDGVAPGGAPIGMTIGEPTHDPPAFLPEILAETSAGFGRYPPNDGTPGLRAAIADWHGRRYGLTLDPETQVLPVNGTREALFNACLALCPEGDGVILTPNPFYQVYAVAALAVGLAPVYVNAAAETGFLPDLAALGPAMLDRTRIAYVCSPANPQGAVASEGWWRDAIALAERHDFRIFADECYSEVYEGTPPPGALAAARAMGADPERVVAFNSLSKRSNLPGLRSGFVAGGPESVAAMKALRNYAGAPIPLPLQAVSERAWGDEAHVVASRARYAEKYRIAQEVLGGVPGFALPQAGFFLWLPALDGEAAALRLWQETGVGVLPGAYLSRDTEAGNPGRGFVRAALVAGEADVRAGLTRLRGCLYE